METFVVLVLVTLILLLPIRLAAGWFGATRRGLGWCLLALVAASILSGLAHYFGGLAWLAGWLLAGVAYSAVLGVRFLPGVLVGLFHVIALFAILAILGTVGIAVSL